MKFSCGVVLVLLTGRNCVLGDDLQLLQTKVSLEDGDLLLDNSFQAVPAAAFEDATHLNWTMIAEIAATETRAAEDTYDTLTKLDAGLLTDAQKAELQHAQFIIDVVDSANMTAFEIAITPKTGPISLAETESSSMGEGDLKQCYKLPCYALNGCLRYTRVPPHVAQMIIDKFACCCAVPSIREAPNYDIPCSNVFGGATTPTLTTTPIATTTPTPTTTPIATTTPTPPTTPIATTTTTAEVEVEGGGGGASAYKWEPCKIAKCKKGRTCCITKPEGQVMKKLWDVGGKDITIKNRDRCLKKKGNLWCTQGGNLYKGN